jgi:hypothetical protein
LLQALPSIQLLPGLSSMHGTAADSGSDSESDESSVCEQLVFSGINWAPPAQQPEPQREVADTHDASAAADQGPAAGALPATDTQRSSDVTPSWLMGAAGRLARDGKRADCDSSAFGSAAPPLELNQAEQCGDTAANNDARVAQEQALLREFLLAVSAQDQQQHSQQQSPFQVTAQGLPTPPSSSSNDDHGSCAASQSTPPQAWPRPAAENLEHAVADVGMHDLDALIARLQAGLVDLDLAATRCACVCV